MKNKNSWLIIFENGTTLNLGAVPELDTPEKAVAEAYDSMENCVPLKRSEMVRVAAVIDLHKIKAVEYGLSLYGMKLGKGE